MRSQISTWLLKKSSINSQNGLYLIEFLSLSVLTFARAYLHLMLSWFNLFIQNSHRQQCERYHNVLKHYKNVLAFRLQLQDFWHGGFRCLCHGNTVIFTHQSRPCICPSRPCCSFLEHDLFVHYLRPVPSPRLRCHSYSPFYAMPSSLMSIYNCIIRFLKGPMSTSDQ